MYFSGLVGVHWMGSQSSWEKFRGVDALSKSVAAFLDTKKTAKQSASPIGESTSPRMYSAVTPLGRSNDTQSSPQPDQFTEADHLALRLYNELNPRFPSVQSPFVSDKQWRYESPLLPPDVSPRYIGAVVPKSYRDGKFHPLLTPTQADSVNRLHLSPRPPLSTIQHSLSKQHAKLERIATNAAAGTPQQPGPSPRKKKHMAKKDETQVAQDLDKWKGIHAAQITVATPVQNDKLHLLPQ